MIVREEEINNLDNQELSVVPTKTLIRKFGRPEDNVTLSIFDLNGNLLFTRENFKDFRAPDIITDPGGLYNEINIDYTETLRKLGYTSGQYRLVLGFYRKLILNNFTKPFYISEISPSRREIKIKSNTLSDDDIINGFTSIISLIQDSAYFREFNLIFNSTTQATGINYQIDSISEPTEVLIKLYDPLPNSISKNSPFRIAEEIINPISVTVDLGEPALEELIVGEEIKGPNLRIDTRLNSSKPSAFRSYDQILNGSTSSSFSNINNYLSSSLELAIDFTDTDTETGFHFENFIHFSSAVERLKNFRYKLTLLESYDGDINDIDTLEGDQTSSAVVIAERSNIEKKKQALIGSFDPYERFLYYESGTYAWPKTTTSKPHTLSLVNSNEARRWIGSENYNSGYYGGQLLSASAYDDVNIHRLTDTLPEHVVSNPDNEQYVLFTNMVGEHFDKIWIYIDHITNQKEADSKLTRGVSKDLVYETLKASGLKVFDQFENENLFGYIAGDVGADGNFQYQAPISQSMVSASNEGSIPKGDITKEVWNRLYDNLPYLLKTKGTERGMKALISCYGIPESILHVKEYGGPVADKTTFRTFTYPKASQMVNAIGSSGTSGIIRVKNWGNDSSNNLETKTIQFRVLPNQDEEIIPLISDINGATKDFVLHITKSVDDTKLDSGSYGKLLWVTGSGPSGGVGGDISNAQNAVFSSSAVPFYNGDIWNISIVFNSGSDLGNTINLYATDTTYHKNTHIATCSIDAEDMFQSSVWGGGDIFILPTNGYNNNQTQTSSSIQELRFWNENLTENTIVSQSLSPFNYNGNSISSSYEQLAYRFPLGSDDSILTEGASYSLSSSLVNKPPNTGLALPGSVTLDKFFPGQYVAVQENHHLTTPDTVGKSMVSDKVRLDTGTIDSDILSPFIRSEESTQDRQPNDFSDLGVFFSPTFEINEDIIYTLGGFRMDDYIGDPRHYVSSSYPDLDSLKNIYVQKFSDRITNMWDYIKLIQYFDHTLFKMIEQFAPAKANLKTGLVIEPHYLERYKLKGLGLTTENIGYDLNLGQVDPPLSSEYLLHEADIDVNGYIVEGSGGDLENNILFGRTSDRYYTRIKLYDQLVQDTTPPIDNTGTPSAPPIRGDQ